MKQIRISRISAIHYTKLVFRSALLLWAGATYFFNAPLRHMTFAEAAPQFRAQLILVWIVFAAEMTLRFFPSRWESMGCQKQFARNYLGTGIKRSKPVLRTAKETFCVAIVWVALNGQIGILYFKNVIDDGILFLISLFYTVSDMICILFFCPFQSWLMKNRCCTTCRIYNWDYLMMFTPLIFVRSFYTWSLIALAAALLVCWEIAVHRHPERFLPQFNARLQCANCQEKLCAHKKQLHRLWKSRQARLARFRGKV